MNRIYNQSLFDEIVSLQASIARATDYAAGVLRDDLRKMLREYATADFIIFCCDCDSRPFWVTGKQLKDAEDCVECEYCGQMCNRLLANGTWQSQAERDMLNQVEYQKVSRE